MEPIIHVGKDGVNENMIKQASDALEARELIKGTVFAEQPDERPRRDCRPLRGHERRAGAVHRQSLRDLPRAGKKTRRLCFRKEKPKTIKTRDCKSGQSLVFIGKVLFGADFTAATMPPQIISAPRIKLGVTVSCRNSTPKIAETSGCIG